MFSMYFLRSSGLTSQEPRYRARILSKRFSNSPMLPNIIVMSDGSSLAVFFSGILTHSPFMTAGGSRPIVLRHAAQWCKKSWEMLLSSAQSPVKPTFKSITLHFCAHSRHDARLSKWTGRPSKTMNNFFEVNLRGNWNEDSIGGALPTTHTAANSVFGKFAWRIVDTVVFRSTTLLNTECLTVSAMIFHHSVSILFYHFTPSCASEEINQLDKSRNIHTLDRLSSKS